MFTLRRSLFDRIALAVVGLVLAIVLGACNGLGRLDAILYDQFVSLDAQPASPDIVIVAIDERSLAEVGRWPWSRSVHTDLVERISGQEPAALGLDLLLSEPDANRTTDLLFAQAIQRSGRVVLPVFTARMPGQAVEPMLPVDPMAGAARVLGHVSIESDPDGVVRSVFLREGTGIHWWSHFAVNLLETAREAPLPALPGRRAPAFDDDEAQASVWHRDYWMHIAFAGPAGTYRSVSAADVLQGEVPDDLFRDRIVMLGSTASGLGDVYPTPLSGQLGYTPGVEVSANIVDNLMNGHWLLRAQPWQNMLFTFVAVLLLLPMLWHFSPKRTLVGVVALLALTLSASYAGVVLGRLWLAPGAALVVIVLVYLLWSWRRLEIAAGYLAEELSRLRQDDPVLPGVVDLPQGDLLDRRIRALAQAADHLRALHAFISSAVESLPDITLVVDHKGEVMLANQAAVRYFAGDPGSTLRGRALGELLQGLAPLSGGALPSQRGTLDLTRHVDPIECRDERQAEFLFKCVPCLGGEDYPAVWIVSLVDITPLRQAERKRDEALRFLSHDMRSPQAAILALIDVYEGDAQSMSQGELLGRIRKHAGRTQVLADAFVQLARAESVGFAREPLDASDVMMDAADDCWSLGQARGIAVDTDLPDDPAEVVGDRGMLTRAIINLINNAIKYSPANTTVTCRVARVGDTWCLSVRDQGRGISPEDQTRLFQRFARFGAGDATDEPGVGLGLAFTKTVVDRHQGRIVFESTLGQGSHVQIFLPADPEAPAA